jgi:hypothetical protein
MVEISLRLVRRAHGNLDAEALESLEIIHLVRQGITEIDNLEVFSQIKELHLGGNKIKVVENVSFLSKLEFLDLSNNLIDEAGLRKCLGRLPSSLLTLVLSGNPCCNDHSLLGELNDLMPNLGIVVGEEEAMLEEKGGESDESQDERDNEGAQGQYTLTLGYGDDYCLKEGQVLDSEEVLRAVVARKCAQQNLDSQPTDMQETVKSLNMECEAALLHIQRRNGREKGCEKQKPDAVARGGKDGMDGMEGANTVFVGTALSRLSAQKSEANVFLKNSQVRAQESRGFLASIREKAMRSRAEKMEQAKKDVV